MLFSLYSSLMRNEQRNHDGNLFNLKINKKRRREKKSKRKPALSLLPEEVCRCKKALKDI